MVKRVNAAQLQSKMRAAQQKLKREADRVDRENKRRVDAYNREVKRVNENNQRVNEHNRKVNAQNQRAVTQLNSRLRSTGKRSVAYTPAEQELADRVQHGIVDRDGREWDVFLSYARIDGSVVAAELKEELEALEVRVWFDEVAIVPGRSQSLQMDKGLRTARSGVVLLTPAYLTGRFWTERELGVLLGKATLIPVLNGVSFKDVAEYSGFLPDLAGFETTRDSVQVIAEKIAAAVLPAESSSVG